MDRSSPAGGYNFGNKRQYRRTIWARVARVYARRQGSTNVLLMPSIEGDEIDVALSKKFRQVNMHVVDRNPAIVAHLKRRYPHINTYGVDIVEAIKRIGKKGIKLDFANLDLCGNITSLSQTLLDVGSLSDGFADRHLIAVTMLRGREDSLALMSRVAKWMKATLSHQGEVDNDEVRSFYLQGALKGAVPGWKPPMKNPGVWMVCRVGEPYIYKSIAGNQTFIVNFFLRHNHAVCKCELCSEPKIYIEEDISQSWA